MLRNRDMMVIGGFAGFANAGITVRLLILASSFFSCHIAVSLKNVDLFSILRLIVAILIILCSFSPLFI